jgi:hypothetical protein
MKKGVGSDPLVRGTDPGIRIRICTKMSRMPNTAFWIPVLSAMSMVFSFRRKDPGSFTKLMKAYHGPEPELKSTGLRSISKLLEKAKNMLLPEGKW